MRDLIRKRFGFSLTLQAVGEYLARWKMTQQKPARQGKEKDDEEAPEFVEETLSDAVEQAEDEDGQLHFADQIGAGYAPIGQTTTWEVPKTRIKQNLISSVTPEVDMLSWLFLGTMNAVALLEFLDRLLNWADRKVSLFLDHHPASEAKQVEDHARDHADQIELVWLPGIQPRRVFDQRPQTELGVRAGPGS